MRLSRLLAGLGTKQILGNTDLEISGLAYDSRQIKPGFLFGAIRGTNSDGHLFVKNARENGAAALLVEAPVPGGDIPQIVVANSRAALAEIAGNFFDHPTEKLKLLGVTGTNGKTTVTHLCESILKEAGFRTGLAGTIHNKIGDEIVPCKNTTPESVDLLELFHKMVENGVGAAAMEVSSHALDQGRIHGILFDAVIFTNLTQDHLDYHRTMEDYFKAKAKLFIEIPLLKKPKGIVNADDPYGKRLMEISKIPVLSYGIAEGEVRGTDIRMDWHGISFRALTPAGDFPAALTLSGRFNVHNALAAIAAGIQLGFSVEVIRNGLLKTGQVRGRFELVEKGQDFAVVVDYAHSPNGLENLLQSARALTPNRLLVVFGCGGDRDRGKRPIMGGIAESLGDKVFITSDNPRTENPLSIMAEIKAGMKEKHFADPDRKKAIEAALSEARKGDCVVIAGKGHETYQIFKEATVHFDDREVAEAFLNRGAPQPS